MTAAVVKKVKHQSSASDKSAADPSSDGGDQQVKEPDAEDSED